MKAAAVTGILLSVTAAAGWLLWPASLGGRTTYVTTHGVSMEPRFHTGDLAVLRDTSSYHVGDVAAYRSDLLHTVVMHRIVAIHDGLYTFKGDNNSWRDPGVVSHSQLLGRLAVRIPDGGVWLKRASSPPALAAFAFVLAVSGGTVSVTRRKRRRRGMSRHAAPRSRPPVSVTALPTPFRVGAGIVAVVGVAAIALGAFAWTRPVTGKSLVRVSQKQTLAFSYRAHVRPSAAYSGTTVTAPDPIFRKVAHRVDLLYRYVGAPGSISTEANLSAPSGWHATVPLSSPVAISTGNYSGRVSLDVNTLDARAQAAGAAIGIPATQVDVAIVATVHPQVGADFTAKLSLVLTPLQLALVDASKPLTVTGWTNVTRPAEVDRRLSFQHRSVTVAQARRVATVAGLADLLALLVLLFLARQLNAGSEGARIRRRYRELLLPVAPIPTPPGRPVVDVTQFGSLVRLAERYGLLIMHWSRSGTDTFVVQDEATTFRYRAPIDPALSEDQVVGPEPDGLRDNTQNSLPSGSASVIQPLLSARR